MTQQQIWQELANARVFDLGQPYFVGMPHFPTHPPFLFSLTKQHGEVVASNGMSSSADAMALGCHTGTHIDALCHFSLSGKLHGGQPAKDLQSYRDGLGCHSADSIGPIVRRGVLLDIAANEGVEALTPEFSVTSSDIQQTARNQGVDIRAGDVVLLRTGWGRFWNDPERFVTGGRHGQPCGPGPETGGAMWLSSRRIFAAGSDTVAFERLPAATMPVHVHLLVESGIHIIENLNLEELSRQKVYEFLFVAAPLKIRGATGAPLRPLAIV